MSNPRRVFIACGTLTVILVCIVTIYLYKNSSTGLSTRSSTLGGDDGSMTVQTIHFKKEIKSRRSKAGDTDIKDGPTTDKTQQQTKEQVLKYFHTYPDVTNKEESVSTTHTVYNSLQSHEKQTPSTNQTKRNKLWTKESERGEFQRQQVERFCNKYNMKKQALSLPSEMTQSTINFYKRLLHNDEAETIFCIAPKVGSTSLIVLYFIAQGLLPESKATISRGQLSNSELQNIVDHHSLAALSERERLKRAKAYFKFVMYRNPLERLVSGYRSKIQNYPLIGFNGKQPHYNWLRHNIYKNTHPVRYQVWKEQGGKNPIQIPFVDFVKFWLSGGRGSNDGHFMPIFDLCEPCRVRYSYYGNFATFHEDAQVLMDKIGASSNQLRQGFYEKNTNASTSSLVVSYYSQLNDTLKRGVLRKLSRDLDFYYHVFPSEIDVHKRLLELDDELPLP